MKTLRYLAAIVLLVAGAMHFYLTIYPTPEYASIIMFIFGILYCTTGVLLLMKKRFALWLGLIPILPIAMTPFMLNLNNLDWTAIMFPMELIAVICCIILLVKKSKG